MQSFHTLISVAQARALSGDVRYVDCRHQLTDALWGEQQYQLGHIAGACFAHLDRDLSSPVIAGASGRHPLPEPSALARFFASLGIQPQTQVIAYDQDLGMYGARLWWLLRAMGHTKVAVLDGGYAQWCAQRGPVDTHIPAPVHGPFIGVWNPDMVDAAHVLEQLQTPQQLLIDARSATRFRGEEEPIDRKAGHIPGAKNFPYTGNARDGLWLDAAQLRARFASLQHKEVISYCGSGVTACHNILAMVHAGLPEPKLYPGSWSEWIVDDSRPVESGA